MPSEPNLERTRVALERSPRRWCERLTELALELEAESGTAMRHGLYELETELSNAAQAAASWAEELATNPQLLER